MFVMSGNINIKFSARTSFKVESKQILRKLDICQNTKKVSNEICKVATQRLKYCYVERTNWMNCINPTGKGKPTLLSTSEQQRILVIVHLRDELLCCCIQYSASMYN